MMGRKRIRAASAIYQRDETDLRINVERRCPAVGKKFAERHFQESKKKSAENGEWNRAKQNNEGIAEAVELRGENEKDKHNGQHEDREKLASFGAQLARFASVIDNVTFRQNLVRLVLEKL